MNNSRQPPGTTSRKARAITAKSSRNQQSKSNCQQQLMHGRPRMALGTEPRQWRRCSKLITSNPAGRSFNHDKPQGLCQAGGHSSTQNPERSSRQAQRALQHVGDAQHNRASRAKTTQGANKKYEAGLDQGKALSIQVCSLSPGKQR